MLSGKNCDAYQRINGDNLMDGDRLPGLSRCYTKAYKQLCEDKLGNEEIARTVIEGVIKDFKNKFRNETLSLLENMATNLCEIPNEPLFKKEVDWGQESMKVYDLAQQSDASTRAKDLAIRAGKQLLQGIKEGHQLNNIKKALLEKFCHEVYKAQFEESLPLSGHHNDEDEITLNAYLNNIRPYIGESLQNLAGQMMDKGDMSSLRMPRRSNKKIKIDEIDWENDTMLDILGK